MKINEANFIDSAGQWFDSKLRDLARNCKTDKDGKEMMAGAPQKIRLRELEKEYFGVTLLDFANKKGIDITDVYQKLYRPPDPDK